MKAYPRRMVCGVALAAAVALWGGGVPADAQTVYRTGQSVQPVFEGWSQNTDGTFTMWFGYLNRNYEERPHIPVGPNNHFAPGPVDRGQPTHFYPRRQNFLFGVTVPADWGDKDLVWTMSHKDQVYTASGRSGRRGRSMKGSGGPTAGRVSVAARARKPMPTSHRRFVSSVTTA
ncbi:MAG TPA: hypothetical protein QF572_07685 [Vicinamibacterales bacterium]|nr:hypothetical protein [Vicinamibacterales bacterium]